MPITVWCDYIYGISDALRTIYQPPHVIDLAWKLLIQNTQIYKEYWFELWGAFIDRVEERLKSDEHGDGYNKLKLMDDFHINNDNYFRKYAPLWYINAYFYSSYSFSKSILVKKDMLESIIKHIDDLIINSKDATYLTISKLWNEVIDYISCINHSSLELKDHDSIKISLIESIYNISSFPPDFIRFLYVDFSKSLLSNFEQTYWLNNVDSTLIIVEYLKFLTICKNYNENFSPSVWVDQFWHHHMTYDTKQYRHFWENTLGSEIEHLEHDPSSMNIYEKLSVIDKSKRFAEAYFEWFGESPPEWIWPELTLDSWNKDNNFVFINIYNTFNMKFWIKSCN